MAFMDIKSANKAHGMEHKMEDRLLRTNYYDPSSFDVTSICDRNNTTSTASPRVNPEDCGPGPGGGVGGGSGGNGSAPGDLHDTTTSSRSSHGGRDFRSGSSSNRYEDSPYGRQSRGSRSYRGQTAFERYCFLRFTYFCKKKKKRNTMPAADVSCSFTKFLF